MRKSPRSNGKAKVVEERLILAIEGDGFLQVLQRILDRQGHVVVPCDVPLPPMSGDTLRSTFNARDLGKVLVIGESTGEEFERQLREHAPEWLNDEVHCSYWKVVAE